MYSLSKKSHSSKSKRELIEDLERIESLLEAHSIAPESDGISPGREAHAPTGAGSPGLELRRAFEAMPYAIAKFGADDRLVACNQLYRDMQYLPDELTVPGVEFEQILRACVERGLIVDAIGREEEYFEQRMHAHRHPGKPVVYQWKQGQWLEVYEEKTDDGGTICIDRDITAQKLAEEAQTIGEAHYVSALNAGKVGIWVWDIGKEEVLVTPNIPPMLGYSIEEFSNHIDDWKELIHPEDREKVGRIMEEHLAGDSPSFEVEHRKIHRDGGFRWFLCRGSALRDASGRALRIRGTETDITAIKQAELTLKESESRYRSLVEGSIQGIVVHRNFKPVFANQAFAVMHGFDSAGEVLAMDSLRDLISPEDRDHITDIYKSRQNDDNAGQRYTFRALRKDGAIITRENIVSSILWEGHPATLVTTQDVSERKAAEEGLQYHKQLLETVLHAIPSAVWVKDKEEKFLLVNKAMADTYGREAEEFLGKTSSQIGHLPEETVRWIGEIDRQVLETGEEVIVPERSMEGSNGDYSVRHVTKLPLKDESGETVAVLGVSRDITERIRAEAELRHSQQRMAGILEIADDAIVSVDEHQIITMYNSGAERIFGFTAQEAIGQHLDMLLPDHIRPVHGHHMENFSNASHVSRSMSERSEIFGQRKDGELFPAEASISKLDLEGSKIYTVMLRDITQRKLTEESLRSSRRLLQTVFDTIPHMILVKDINGRYLMSNTAATDFLGLPPEQILNKSADEIINRSDEDTRGTMESDDLLFSSGRAVTNQVIRQHSDGRKLDLQTIRAPLRDDEGNITGLVMVGVDITERVQAERRAKEAHERLVDAVENMPQGFALFDSQDRLVLWNEKYSDTNADVRDVMEPGVKFEELLEAIKSRGHRSFSGTSEPGWIAERMKQHLNPQAPREWQGYDGRWYLISEKKTREGGITGVWTDITAAKQTEQALRASERLLQTVFDAISHQIIVKDIEGRYLVINKAASEFLGLTQEEVRGKHPSELEEKLVPDKEKLAEMHRQFVDSGQRIFHSEYELTSHDGQKIIKTGVRSMLLDDDGNPEGTVLVATDITEQRKAEQRASQSHERLLDAVESISQGFVLYDPDDRLVLWNEKFAEINADIKDLLVPGVTFEALVRGAATRGRVLESNADPEDFIRERMAYHSNPKGSVERRGSRGEWYLATERRTSDGGTTGVWTDITERKHVEEALRAREEQLQLFITHAPVAVAMFDRDMRFIVHSRRWVEDFNLEADNLIGRSQYEVFPETPKHWVEAYQRCLGGEVERCDEESIPRADGTLWWLRWEMHPWRNSSGEISGIVSFIEVINDRKKTEAQLIRSQRMEAVGQLTGGVAHEFNNLLHIIQSYAFLLAENAGDAKKIAVLVEPIQNATNRGRDLVKRLLAFSRRQILQPKSIDLGEVALDLIELIRPPLGESIELVSVTSENLWPILVDQGELENALLNLALNARDAMPNGGKLTITTENHSPADPTETGDEENTGREYVRLSVTDSGEGMTPETREQAFEPFFTTKGMAEHSGLGLSMVHGFVNQSGGYVIIDSNPNEGTTVSLYLPRV